MSTTVKLSGHVIEDFTPTGPYGSDDSLIVNLAAFSQWTGGFHALAHNLLDGVTVNGSLGAKFMNTHSDALYTGGSSTVNAVVAGNGSFTVANGATLTFDQAVGRGQIVDVGTNLMGPAPGTLQLNDPKEFAGIVDLAVGFVDLKGLLNAASFTFANEILSLYGTGKTPIDTLRLTGSAFEVVKTTVGIMIGTTDPYFHTPAWFATQGTVLPVHT